MKIIAGLGNPGAKYAKTAHNVGFEIVDLLAERWGIALREQSRANALIGEGRIDSEPAMLVKPLTFMNLSGNTIGYLARQRELERDDLLVLTDDVNLPLGRLRIRESGSHGGQNGLRNIIERLGTDQFARLRVGIRPEREIEDLTRFVLSKLPPEERKVIEEMQGVAADAVEYWMKHSTRATLTKFNGYRGGRG